MLGQEHVQLAQLLLLVGRKLTDGLAKLGAGSELGVLRAAVGDIPVFRLVQADATLVLRYQRGSRHK